MPASELAPGPVSIRTSGVHHVAFRVTDLARAKIFYVERLGFPLLMATPDLFLIAAGATAVAVRAPDPTTDPNDAFNPFRVGLDHIALACADDEELHRVADALSAAGVENTGVKRDDLLGKHYVAFRDPDGIKWEFYQA